MAITNYNLSLGGYPNLSHQPATFSILLDSDPDIRAIVYIDRTVVRVTHTHTHKRKKMVLLGIHGEFGAHVGRETSGKAGEIEGGREREEGRGRGRKRGESKRGEDRGGGEGGRGEEGED